MNGNLEECIYRVIGETTIRYGFETAVAATTIGITENYWQHFTNAGEMRTRENLLKGLIASGEELDAGTTNYSFFDGLITCYLKVLIQSVNIYGYKPQNDNEMQLLNTYNSLKDSPSCTEILKEQLLAQKQISTENLMNRRMISSFVGDMIDTISKIYMLEKNMANFQQQERVSNVQISNVQIHGDAVQKVSKEMISGLTYAKEGSLEIGNMSACTSIGKKRENQEDAVLLKEHPQNPNFKFLVVADGMGGGDSGEVVSDYTVSELSKWFENLPVAYYKDPDKVSFALQEKIQNISSEMYQRYWGRAGTTFVGAIVGEKETVISNTGDSRAYVYSNHFKMLEQISEDESLVERLYRAKEIERRDDMRFHREGNVILTHIGSKETVNPKTVIIPNEAYDKLILVSDGVSDCLSDEKILAITKRTPREKLAQMLVQSALDNISYARPKLSRDIYYDKINGGKDNTTAAVLDKKTKRRRGEEYDI